MVGATNRLAFKVGRLGVTVLIKDRLDVGAVVCSAIRAVAMAVKQFGGKFFYEVSKYCADVSMIAEGNFTEQRLVGSLATREAERWIIWFH